MIKEFDLENCYYCGKPVDQSGYTAVEIICSTLFSYPGNYICHKECGPTKAVKKTEMPVA